MSELRAIDREFIPLTFAELDTRSGSKWDERFKAVQNGVHSVSAKSTANGKSGLPYWLNPFLALLEKSLEDNLPIPDIFSIRLSEEAGSLVALNPEVQSFFQSSPDDIYQPHEPEFSDKVTETFFRNTKPYVGFVSGDDSEDRNAPLHALALDTGSLLVGSKINLARFAAIAHEPAIIYSAIIRRQDAGIVWVAAASEAVQTVNAAIIAANGHANLLTPESKERPFQEGGLIDPVEKLVIETNAALGNRPNGHIVQIRRYELKPLQPR